MRDKCSNPLARLELNLFIQAYLRSWPGPPGYHYEGPSRRSVLTQVDLRLTQSARPLALPMITTAAGAGPLEHLKLHLQDPIPRVTAADDWEAAFVDTTGMGMARTSVWGPTYAAGMLRYPFGQASSWVEVAT